MSSSARFLTAIDASQFLPGERTNYSASWFAMVEKLVDFSAVTAAVIVADVLYRTIEPKRAVTYAPSTVLLSASGLALLFVFLLERHSGYRPCVSLLAIRETERVLRVTLQSLAMVLAAVYFSVAHISRLAMALTLILVPLFVTFEKWEIRHLVRRVPSKRHGGRRALILGTGNAARRIYTALVRSPSFDINPVAFITKSNLNVPSTIFECDYQREHSAPVLSGPVNSVLLRQLRASVLIITESSLSQESILQLVREASGVGVVSYFATGDFLEPGYWLDYTEVDGIMLAHVSRGSNRLFYEFAKRMLDLTVAIIALVLFGPLGVLLALIIKVTSPGPVLFRQERVGRQGQLFAMYKFRSMYVDAPRYSYSPTAGADPRITPIGRLLRRTSLDEIPQLINVLLGHMSVVGPRPEMPFIVEQYTPSQQQRLAVKPGITGLWQISADRAFLIHENVEYDLYYGRHRSLFMDFAVILHTFLRLAHGV
jgi:exopolysaccharide biosynthesis polyprenyl glycosylphosphotransferase